MRQVKGVLFVDYVRMLRAKKGVDWTGALAPEDFPYLQMQIDPEAWYPMETFERMGNAILGPIAGAKMEPVRLWGRMSAVQLHAANPKLLAPRDPVETINRFRVLRETYFDFDALTVLLLHEDEAQIVIRYHMGNAAEEAASYQTMGFFEGLLELAGAREVMASFRERWWTGDRRTLLALRWTRPAQLI
jgi:hypothetical protein